MIFLRALTLSLTILIPRIFLIPVFAVLYVVAFLAISVVVVVLLFVSEALAMIVGALLVLALMAFPMMVSMRLGLDAQRCKVTGTYGSLVFPAMIYGGIEAVGMLLSTLVGIAAFAFISPDLSFLDFGSFENFTDGTAIEIALETGETSAMIIFLIGFLAVSALRAALLVPLAGAAAGRDANAELHTPLVGFGTGLLPLTALVLLSYLLLPFMLYIGFALANLLGSTDVFQGGDGSDLANYGWAEIVMIICFWMGWVWIFCLQCAGGVLFYLRQRDAYVVQDIKVSEADRMQPTDARALRKSRS